jgi:CRP-like cAMP-binding protein
MGGFDGVLSNRFLRSLPKEVARRLVKVSEQAPMTRGAIVVEAGAFPAHIYFPDRGLLSLVKPMSDGRTAEVGFVGVEGLSNVSALMGVPLSPFDVVVQLEGHAIRIATADLRREMEASPVLSKLVVRYLYFKMSQLAQTAACNRLHSLRQRCCRWLLLAHDNAREDEFTLTHEFLALMMGVNRPALTLTLSGLQKHGHVRYRRASLHIVDRASLEDGACECYATLRDDLDRVYADLR